MEIATWRGHYAGRNGPVARRRQASPLVPGGMPTEARLEELIEAEPTILFGDPLLIIGRQVATSFGKVIDLLAVDADGILHVLELTKDKTPREVVAQVLDYGSWVRNLAHEDVLKLFADYGEGGAFEVAFQQRFDTSPPEGAEYRPPADYHRPRGRCRDRADHRGLFRRSCRSAEQ